MRDIDPYAGDGAGPFGVVILVEQDVVVGVGRQPDVFPQLLVKLALAQPA